MYGLPCFLWCVACSNAKAKARSCASEYAVPAKVSPNGLSTGDARAMHQSACQRRLEPLHYSLPGKVAVGLVSMVLHLSRHADCRCETERNGNLRVARLRPAGSHTGRQDEGVQPIRGQARIDDSLRLVHLCFCLGIGRITQSARPFGFDEPARMLNGSEGVFGMVRLSSTHSANPS